VSASRGLQRPHASHNVQKEQIMRTTLLSALVAAALTPALFAQTVQLQVTVQNLAPTNSVSFAPLRVGFGNGTYDSFNNGMTAGPAIVSIAEGGSGADWFPAFAAAEPNATLGTVVPNPAGPLLPGAMASAVFTVNPTTNRFFTFGSMIVPSNDYFIGNDSPTQHMLFDAMGNLNITSISQRGSDIWDAGSEVDGAFGAAFLMGQMNSDRIADTGVVAFDFMGLNVFNGLTTAAGYTFDRQFGANDEVYRISFAIVPAPAALGLVGVGALASLRRRR
jgi:hypothetical protein